MGTFTDKDREKLTEVHTLVTTMLPDHEIRIRKNERFRYMACAWASGAGLLASSCWEYIRDKLTQ